MNKNFALAFAMSLAVVGCSSAPKSNEVSAAYVPVAQYNNYACEQLINEAEAIRRATPALETAVDKHRSNQTGVEVVTWVLFWPAAFALDKGEAHSSQLAKAKGEMQAIQTALLANKCSEKTNLNVVASAAATPVAAIQPQPASAPTQSAAGQNIKEKLKDLEHMRKEGLVTEAEYSAKRTQMLEKL